MKYRKVIKIFPGEIKGSVMAPASKSMMIRDIAVAHLAESPMTIHRPAYCDDALAALQATKALGSRFEEDGEKVIFKGSEKVKFAELNCGESGLAIRMFPPLAAINGGHFIFNAEGSLRKRPLEMMLKPLRTLGLQVNSRNGFAPLEIKGQLRGGEIEVDGSMSSQFLSGLLMSLPLVKRSSVIKVIQLKSIPYIDMTLQVMARHDVQVQHRDYKEFVVKGNQHYSGRDETVEGDWSGAAFLLVAGAIGGSIMVTGLNLHSKQADRRILNALELAGAKVTTDKEMVRVERDNLKPFNLDITQCPDLAPPLVVLAAYCSGITRLTGAGRLSVKESDRAKVLQSEFSNLGVDIRLEGDEMLIKGGKIKGGLFDSHGDHRMAMAAAIAGIGAESPVEISDPGCVSKSYPGFFKDLINIGGKI